MANGDNTTAAEDLNEQGLTETSNNTGIQIPVDPNAVTPPERLVDLNSTKTLDFLKQDNLTSPRLVTMNNGTPVSSATGLAATLPSTLKGRRGPGGTQWTYVGENLVDEKNVISQGKYKIDKEDIYKEFFRLKNDAQRAQLFETMQRLNFYGKDKPSPQALRGLGLTGSDYRALEDFMELSNSKGRTMKALVDLAATGGMKLPTGLATGGRTISVVSREDAEKQTGSAFFALLGRAATPAEIKIAVQAIQGADRQRQLSNTEDPSSLGVAAEQQAKTSAPGEFGAYSAGKAVNQIFSLLGKA